MPRSLARDEVILQPVNVASNYQFVYDTSGKGDSFAFQVNYADTNPPQVDFTIFNEENWTATCPNHGLVTGSAIQFNVFSGTLPTLLYLDTDYFLIVIDANTVRFAYTNLEAANGLFIYFSEVVAGSFSLNSKTQDPENNPNVITIGMSDDGVTPTAITSLVLSSVVPSVITQLQTSLGRTWDVGYPSSRYIHIIYAASGYGTTTLKVYVNSWVHLGET